MRFIQQVIFSAAVACGKVEWGSNLMASHVIYKNDIRFDVVTGSLGCCNIFWRGSMPALRAKTEAPAGQTRRRKNKQSSFTQDHMFQDFHVSSIRSRFCLWTPNLILYDIRILVSLETIQLAPRSMSNCNSGKCPCHAAWQNCNNKRQKFFQRLEQTRRFIAEPGESHQKTWNSVLEVLKRAENLKKLTTPEKNERIWMSPFCNL